MTELEVDLQRSSTIVARAEGRMRGYLKADGGGCLEVRRSGDHTSVSPFRVLVDSQTVLP